MPNFTKIAFMHFLINFLFFSSWTQMILNDLETWIYMYIQGHRLYFLNFYSLRSFMQYVLQYYNYWT